ncbi:hypothetical protein HBI56_163480 [Parastagonospora nodorum]|uniref:Uncharacterized protein n=1 Tax=Phaeosphaeria nodorum (strain SN15 / ATCC MYA-4574 / FGSC 10173) TaxID=321614 RepID=A0A7U2I9R6_PHANO|nr:hypothetical protein HBH56_125760 [Parastagonospora nodorum]QRD05842.1 hypothetical protein JI435_444970 [Parastagonospora nodorum SN15]KAH3931352.1 hypothetical protein HBH54_097750 [Parastagonospora nodorum]KAH3944345.1 hypothetical protein HBH53_159230 [Parastagonospora nodorum]KAH3956857.1 hypothetical protein HBH51_234070 [Parastagonospora nodorum]
MWPVARRRRAVSPPLYPSYDNLDPYHNYPSYDSLSQHAAYGYNYPVAYNPLGIEAFSTSKPTLHAIEAATRVHVTAQKEHEKAKENFEEAKKKMEECEQKVKQAEDMLRVAKCSIVYGN